jgi:hypothetical protein
VYRAAYVESD